MSIQIAELKDLGPRSTEWLEGIGVRTLDDLERLGSIEIYRRLKSMEVPVSLNLVYAIEALLLDLDRRELPAKLNAQLKYETLRMAEK